MNLLLISYNTKKPFACFTNNNPIKYFEEHNSELIHASQVFPDRAIREALEYGKNIDNVIFIGKPLIYFKNLLLRHIFLFPRAYFLFTQELQYFFENILQVNKKIKRIKDEVSMEITKKINLDSIYYIKLDEALAFNTRIKGNDIIITCLTDVFEGNSFCCYEKKGDKIILKKELNVSNSFTNLLRILKETKGHINLNEILEIRKTNLFRLKKRYLTIKNNSFSIKNKYIDTKRNYDEMNDKVLQYIFSKLIDSIRRKYNKIIFISDVQMPLIITQSNKDILFKYANEHDIIKSIEKFFHHKIKRK